MENLLILAPRIHEPVIDLQSLATPLTELGLLGEPFFYQGQDHYRPGDAYLQLVTYLGCSPVVSLGEPGHTGNEFAHIAFDQKSSNTLLTGDNSKPPRCRCCRHRFDEWRDQIVPGQTDHLICPNCESELHISKLDWRQCAGYGHCFIKLWGVFEGEAVPSDALTDTLKSHTDIDWDYFYLQFRNN